MNYEVTKLRHDLPFFLRWVGLVGSGGSGLTRYISSLIRLVWFDWIGLIGLG